MSLQETVAERTDSTALDAEPLPWLRDSAPLAQISATHGKPETADLRAVVIGLHRETSTPGRVGSALRLLGHPLDVRRPRFGDPLPPTLDGHAGAVIFGGP